MDKINKNSKKGFTLIEIIVSLAIFSIVALVAVGALIKIVDANKKAQSLKTAINNINYALEAMSRDIRAGTNYYCVATNFSLANNASLPNKSGCQALDKNWIIALYSSKEKSNGAGGFCHLIYVYRFANETIEKAEQKNCGDAIDNSSFYPIISSDITFDHAVTTVNVSSVTDQVQSYVFFHLKGYSGSGKQSVQTSFDIQTSISQNLSD